MFNPYMTNLERLKNQRQEIDNMINNYQNMPQQQPMNVFNVGNTSQIDFEARYLKENENVNEILVQRKTAFIDLKNRQLSIKELNGDVTNYEILLPKDEKDLKIEELEERIRQYEQSTKSDNAFGKSRKHANVNDEPTTKGNGSNVSK